MQTLIHYPSLVNDTFNSFMHQFIIRVLTPSLTERLMASFNLVLTFESVDLNPPRRGLGGGIFPYKRLMGMCRRMGLHFHDWIDYNGVAHFRIFEGKTVLHIYG